MPKWGKKFHQNILYHITLVSNVIKPLRMFLSHTREIRPHDVKGQRTVHMYSYVKILKYGRPTWPNVYVLDFFFNLKSH